MLSRRRFLKVAGALGVVLLAPLDWLAQKLPSNPKSDPHPSGGERYEGFVLLEKDAPVPVSLRAHHVLSPARLAQRTRTTLQ
ncbi:MAG TPA: twin-arginine translocation signal domain-containing protein [Anaerolineae bacterium]|nr:twin-arginine translocation signal domain-containing protein [Anaerolineae bacterium]